LLEIGIHVIPAFGSAVVHAVCKRAYHVSHV
jgi:hypothetical protein